MKIKKTVCVVCNKPLSHHAKITQQLIDASAGATFSNPVAGFRSPLSPLTLGQWATHTPHMVEPTWETPFGTTDVYAP